MVLVLGRGCLAPALFFEVIMTRDECVEALVDCEHEIMFADGFDDAIIGVFFGIFDRPAGVVYDGGMVIDLLVERDGMTEEEATEHFVYNIEGSYVGPGTPLFVAVQ